MVVQLSAETFQNLHATLLQPLNPVPFKTGTGTEKTGLKVDELNAHFNATI